MAETGLGWVSEPGPSETQSCLCQGHLEGDMSAVHGILNICSLCYLLLS